MSNNIKTFYTQILSNALKLLKYSNIQNNFDFDRFRLDHAKKATDFNVNDRIFYFNWFHVKIEEIFAAFCKLSDRRSKDLYISLILFRLCGHLCVKIPVSFDSSPDKIRKYKETEFFGPTQLKLSGIFDNVRHYDFVFEGKRYIADCFGFEWYLYRRQYFYEGEGFTIMPEFGDIVIDGGAFLGDASCVFSNAVGARGRVYGFDPVQDHLEVLNWNINQFVLKNVEGVPFAIGDKIADSPPIRLDGYSPGFNGRGHILPIITLDKFSESLESKRFDFLKLDIEGGEMRALAGGIESIRRNRAKLAISIYHLSSDFFDIINFLSRELKDYSFHLGHYTIHREETVLYGRPLD